jgi:hypothetical protein
VAKDRKPENGRASGGSSRATATRTSGNRPGVGARGDRARTATTNVVAQQRPWGLIAAALAVVVFAAAVIVYAVLQVKKADAGKASSPSDISGLQTYKYGANQGHVTTPVTYAESPPVGGPHDPYWADCTGTVYTQDIRHENAVHSLEHGAVWVTYDPSKVSKADIATLSKLVEGQSYRLMSAYAGLSTPVSIQSWGHELKVQKATDSRLKEFADFFTLNSSYYPEVGASCENPSFKAKPVLQGSASEAVGTTDMPTSAPAPAPSSAP